MAHARAATWDSNVQIFDQGIAWNHGFQGDAPTFLAKKCYFFYSNKNKEDFTNIINDIVTYADSLPNKKIVNLYIICHGSYGQSLAWHKSYLRAHYNQSQTHESSEENLITSSNEPTEFCGAIMGGQGLQFGTYSLSVLEVPLLSKLKNLVGKIIIYGCGVAGNSNPEIEVQTLNNTGQSRDCTFTSKPSVIVAPTADKEFCKQICINTNAFVYAADKEQAYNASVEGRKPHILGDHYEVDFGEWEGQLYEFQPPNGHYIPVTRMGNDYF